MKKIQQTSSKRDYTSAITWTIVFGIMFSIFIAIYQGIKPKKSWIYFEDIEIGKYDSIVDKKNITKLGDTLVIREHSQGRGNSFIWGKYKGYTPQGGPVQIGDTTYYVYYNKVVRIK
jgi:hypothetical protein